MSTIRKIVGQITLKALTDIESTTYYYLLQSSMAPAPDPPTTNPPGGGWSTTEPSFFIYVRTQDTVVTTGKDYYTRSGTGTTQDPYVYTKVITPAVTDLDLYYEKIYGDTKSLYVTVQTLYTDTSFEYSEPSLSSSYEAAKEAYNRAKTALELAGNINQYFWTLSSPYSTNVPAGVYVTKTPQSQFKPNPAEGNILMQNTGLTIRNGAISLASLTSSALNFYSPTTHNPSMQLSGQSLNFYNPNNDSLALSLGSNGLNFYGSSTSTSDASLTSNGLVLTKGGIKAGTDGQNGFVYLSSENYQLKDTTHNGLTINGHTPTAQGTDGKLESDPAWREVIGTKFGVDSEGNLYAAGAHIDGDIIAQSLTIGSGANAYDGMAAINISGYSIEIVISDKESANTALSHEVYLIPYLYHNGIDVTDEVEDFTRFVWYKDNEETGVLGNVDDGGILANSDSVYKVTYTFDDGEVGSGTPIETILVKPTEYITDINDKGILIHPKEWENTSSYIRLDGTGMELLDNNTNIIASFKDVIRLGSITNKHLVITNEGMEILNNTGSLANFNTDFIKLGSDNVNNILIDTNSISVNNGQSTLAEFGETVTLGEQSNCMTIDDDGINIVRNSQSVALYSDHSRIGEVESYNTRLYPQLFGVYQHNDRIFTIAAEDDKIEVYAGVSTFNTTSTDGYSEAFVEALVWHLNNKFYLGNDYRTIYETATNEDTGLFLETPLLLDEYSITKVLGMNSAPIGTVNSNSNQTKYIYCSGDANDYEFIVVSDQTAEQILQRQHFFELADYISNNCYVGDDEKTIYDSSTEEPTIYALRRTITEELDYSYTNNDTPRNYIIDTTVTPIDAFFDNTAVTTTDHIDTSWENYSVKTTVYSFFIECAGTVTSYTFSTNVRKSEESQLISHEAKYAGIGSYTTYATDPETQEPIEVVEYDNGSIVDFIMGGVKTSYQNSEMKVQGEAFFKDNAGVIRALFDFIYPVGSYYETSDASFDPNVTWGGTWSLEASGKVHVSAGTGYTIGATGGNKDAVVPYHTHTISRTTNVAVSVAAHGITQPTFTIPNHTHNVYYRADNNVSSGSGDRLGTPNTNAGTRASVSSSGGGGACTRTTNVALTNNHSVTVTQPAFSAAYAGTSGNATNANMQPYIVVNRWHRTA